MRVERDNELRRGHAGPDAQVERVAANHPSEEQIQPLAGAPFRRAREKIADAGPLRHATVRGSEIERHGACGEAVERRREIGSRRIVAFEKEAFDAARAFEHLSENPKQCHEVAFARPPMDKPLERTGLARRIKRPNVVGRPRAHNRDQTLDGLQHARDAPKRERRGTKADDFLILQALVAPDDLDGIGRGVGVVEIGVKPIEDRLQGRFVDHRI